jgi:hypothetical protein|tara:strand:+ start:412 stop:588 length:177 start_codon:yes stop_codon:yes gene_type:complete
MANKQYKWFLTKRNRMMKKNNSVITDNNDFHNHMKKEKEILDISMKESLKQKEERTKS